MTDWIDCYLTEVAQVVRDLPRGAIAAVADALLGAWRTRRQIFIVGNGGSAATASHMMNDLNKYACVPGRPRFRAIALTDNVPLLTALGNDASYADIFVEPLRNLFQSGDVVIAISASGNSPNVLRAAEYAQAHGGLVIGLCGQPGGRLAEIADHAVVVPSSRIGQQEDAHLILNHALVFALRARLEQEPAA